ncbi:MAG: hypothetical protein NWF04_06435 [Candidatus Bathyarchaeota archaeon]|nr:hypothetical protein [Candidatus Bathyarchaeota archaeon]
MDELISKEKLREHSIQKMFQDLEGEIDLITATAKLGFNLNKTNKETHKITLAYIEDTKKIVATLKSRINLLWETTS